MFAQQGDGPTLVFLPGFGGSGGVFEPQLGHFASNYRTLGWTVPGVSSEPPLDILHVGSLALQSLAELDKAKIDQAHFVGQAIGGMMAQELALRAPERVLSATLFATSPSLGREFKKRFLAERLAPLDAGLHMADMAPALLTKLISPHASPDGIKVAVEALAQAPAPIYRKLIEAAAEFDRRGDMGQISVPVLCLAGEADRMAPPAMMERMAAKIANARFAVVPRAGHEAQLEQPQLFNALLGAFLADLAKMAA